MHLGMCVPAMKKMQDEFHDIIHGSLVQLQTSTDLLMKHWTDAGEYEGDEAEKEAELHLMLIIKASCLQIIVWVNHLYRWNCSFLDTFLK